MTPSRVAAALAAIAASAFGCATPMMHPLRASNGPVLELATSLRVGAGRRGECGDLGCVDSGHRAIAIDPLALSVGYSHVFGGHFGLMAGAQLPAPRGYVVPVAAWSFVTAQNEHASIGAGPDLGVGGGGGTVGGEIQPWGDEPLRFRFGAYGRSFVPFAPRPDAMDGRTSYWEGGGRLRFGPIYLQYAYQTHPGGVVSDPGGATYAQSRHLVTF